MLYALTDSGADLIRFDSAAPGTIISTKQVFGSADTNTVLKLAVRPTTGELYAAVWTGPSPPLSPITITDELEHVDADTGLVGDLTVEEFYSIGPFSSTQNPFPPFVIAFDPVDDQVRAVNSSGQNLHFNPAFGQAPGTTTDASLAYTAGDGQRRPNAGHRGHRLHQRRPGRDHDHAVRN
jgi:hypothetical protein